MNKETWEEACKIQRELGFITRLEERYNELLKTLENVRRNEIEFGRLAANQGEAGANYVDLTEALATFRSAIETEMHIARRALIQQFGDL